MAINRVALYHIETLLWIDRLGTYAAAAARLNTTQPAISARIRELEAHVGAELFRREGRSMSLTPAGRQLVRECGRLWGDLQSALLACGGFGEVSGVIRIGTGEIVAASCLPAFLSQLKADMPQVTLELEIDLTANLIQQLLTGRTDIAFAAGPVTHPALKFRSIGAVSLVWLANPEVAAAFREAAPDRMVPIWSLASHSPIHGRMRDAIATSALPNRPLNLCNNAQMMIDIAKAGGGIGIFPESMVREDMASGALVALDGMPPLEPVMFHVAMRAADNEPVTTEIFHRAGALRLDARGAQPSKLFFS
ncbi:transcriptional regulator [Sphingobium jiangsuense]|uniref:DNA-binding transcriptional LysR family regulator n=1 Tax=Sphingobium jiangsuense TaxID=870476 RepID=A0A7W6BLC5_9SPHN|nr:LysR family transcriptional regulator [Sphingobium jiangsuense]MBB3925702.1 DNA-binding transcriptional LysR family regulator [Sphingobium jiangsuense]GLT00372.1 transcriptional regulator [Sphingobium jiangsuense]